MCVCSNGSVAQSADPFEINKSINYYSFTDAIQTRSHTHLNLLYFAAIRDSLSISLSRHAVVLERQKRKAKEKKKNESTAAATHIAGRKRRIVVNERSLFILHQLQLQLHNKVEVKYLLFLENI